MEQVLLLNKNFEPISIINWRRAVCLFFLDKVEIVEEYDYPIRSQHLIIKMPAVVRLLHNFKRSRKNVGFSKNNIFARDRWNCQYCGERFSANELTLDHVIPKSKGGKTCWENVVSCCSECNSKKANNTPQEARMVLLKNPVKPDWIPIFRFLLSRKYLPEEWKNFCYL